MEKSLTFIKKHQFDIIVTLSVVVFLYELFTGSHAWSLLIVFMYAMGYAADRERSRDNIAERKKLRSRFLTPEDIKNIEFVKSWEETRKNGRTKYCFVYGGVVFGFVLCFIYSIMALIIFNSLLSTIAHDPSNMFNFIGYTFIAGIITGTIIYRFLWTHNEHKFIRLTDPLR